MLCGARGRAARAAWSRRPATVSLAAFAGPSLAQRRDAVDVRRPARRPPRRAGRRRRSRSRGRRRTRSPRARSARRRCRRASGRRRSRRASRRAGGRCQQLARLAPALAEVPVVEGEPGVARGGVALRDPDRPALLERAEAVARGPRTAPGSAVSGRMRTAAHSASPERKRTFARGSSVASGEAIDAPGELEVVGGEPALGVGRDRDRRPCPRRSRGRGGVPCPRRARPARRTNSTEPTKSSRLNSLRIASPARSQPSSSREAASRSPLSSRRWPWRSTSPIVSAA